VGELKMVVTARDDEIASLKDKMFRLQDALTTKEALVAQLEPTCERQEGQLEDLHRQLDESRRAHDVAEQANEEARLQMISQNESNHQLLEKLLAEQRSTFGEVPAVDRPTSLGWPGPFF
jgi:chromosome segregation ATPase